MGGKAVGGALAGGTLATAGWSVFAIVGETEFKLMAWGVGVLVAVGCVLGGGRGQTMGGVCALVAMAAILTAKLFIAADYTAQVEEDLAGMDFTAAQYDKFMADAKDWRGRNGNAMAFLFEHQEYEWNPKPPPDKLDYEVFDEFWAPRLTAWANEPPPFETWKPQFEADVRKLHAERAGFTDQLKAATGPWDIGFILVGVITAFGVVARRGEPEKYAKAGNTVMIDYTQPTKSPPRTQTRTIQSEGIDPEDQPPGMR